MRTACAYAPADQPLAPWKVSLVGVPVAAAHRDIRRSETKLLSALPEFIATLAQHGHASLSAGQWVMLTDSPAGVIVRGSANAPLFLNAQPHQQAMELLQLIDQAPVYRAVALLSKLTEQRESAAQAWLILGVLRAALAALGTARSGAARHRDRDRSIPYREHR